MPVTPQTVRRLSLALPEAVEADHHGMASFRVAGKIFCTLHVGHPRAMVKLTPEDQHNLAAPIPAWSNRPPATGAARARPSSGTSAPTRRCSRC